MKDTEQTGTAPQSARTSADGVHHDLDWFVGSAMRGSAEQDRAAQAWLDSLPPELI